MESVNKSFLYFSSFFNFFAKKKSSQVKHTSNKTVLSLYDGEVNKEYIIKSIDTCGDEELKNFLLSLGCYEGQKVTIISVLKNNMVISIKDARYSIDSDLAQAILI